MQSRLEQILEVVRERVKQAKSSTSIHELQRKAAMHNPRGFRRGLEQAAEERGFAVIAELKKASPSKGLLRGTLHVSRLAYQLEKAGAAALSVLTEEKHFQGSFDNLREASVATSLPVLCKDFIINSYQLYEAKANGADAVLLIASALPGEELAALRRDAGELGLDVLCEVHDEEELRRAIAVEPEMIGVNSRDLRTLQVDTAVHRLLAAKIPREFLMVAESGIHRGDQLRTLRGMGYRGFLVGEALMTADDPGVMLSAMLGQARAPFGGHGLRESSAGTTD